MPIYMQYEGIRGDVTTFGFEGSFEILSLSWGVSNPNGNASLSDVSIMMSELQGITRLMAVCANGKHASKVRISFLDTGSTPREFMRYDLENVLVSSFQLSGTGEGAQLPIESLSLNFTKMTFTIWYPNVKGGFTQQFDSIAPAAGT